MRIRLLFLAPALATCAGPAFAADPVMGSWLNADGKGKVLIAPCSASSAETCGTITWLKEPTEDGRPVHDLHNPDPALRARPVIGVTVIRGMQPAGPGRWTGGRLYDPETGKSYKGRLTALGGGRLKVEGCVLLLCQAQTWTRAD
jgi:uncharacterized protein (DUF2147 family)